MSAKNFTLSFFQPTAEGNGFSERTNPTPEIQWLSTQRTHNSLPKPTMFPMSPHACPLSKISHIFPTPPSRSHMIMSSSQGSQGSQDEQDFDITKLSWERKNVIATKRKANATHK